MTPAPAPRPPHRRHTGWVWLLVLAAAGYAGWHYRPQPTRGPGTPAAAAGGRGGRGGAASVAPVVVATAVRSDIPLFLRGLGTVTPANTVTLHTRVDGQIMQVHFQEGQMVHQGDLLVEIDSRPFQASLAQAEGQLAHDTALYNNDVIDYQRYQTLFKENIVPRQQLDAQAALVNEYKGAMASDQAAIDTAKLNLAYCRITAPITGRIGLRQVDAGNIVHSGDAVGLAVITQVQPIAVLFTLPQENLPQVYSELRAGQHPAVTAFDSTNTKPLANGRLETIDNSIDPTTGTFRLKALFDNTDNALFPNQFVNARMQVGTAAGLTVVPPAAVQRGPEGTYVFVVSAANRVSVRDVQVQVTEGSQVGLASGLQPGENVVVDGADKLQEGTQVEARLANGQPATTAAGAAAAGGDNGRAGRHRRGRAPRTAPATDH